MDHWTFVSLRLLHILGGVFWVGAAVFLAAFLGPVVNAAGPAGGSVMHGLEQRRHMGQFIGIAAWITILAGIPIYWRISGHLNRDWIMSDPGLAYTAGALLALSAAGLGMFVNAPTSKRIGMIGERMAQAASPPSDEQMGELGALRARMARASLLDASLLGLATVGMGIARYL